MFNALGSFYGDLTPPIKSWLSASGYQLAAGDATVEGLKKVSGDGIFYFNTHGGWLTKIKFCGRIKLDGIFYFNTHGGWRPNIHGERVYGLFTSTPVNDANDILLKEDLDKGRLRYASAPHDINPDFDPEVDPDPRSEECKNADPPCKKPYTNASHYAITAKFVEHYMSFGGNSFVYIDACSSETNEIKQAFLGKPGVSVHAGWTGSVGNGFGTSATRFLFDGLLGTFSLEKVA
ncbi:MAG: hypothetical protein E3J21_10775 [Anaerolineales bacterium]|nr:MAG: hypothetical protein E3J21_10775 [Anaerolineales bacterium]